MDNLGTEIRKIRKSKHLTLDQLSKASGVDRSTISAYETQRYIPNMRTAAILLDALGYEMAIRKKTAV